MTTQSAKPDIFFMRKCWEILLSNSTYPYVLCWSIKAVATTDLVITTVLYQMTMWKQYVGAKASLIVTEYYHRNLLLPSGLRSQLIVALMFTTSTVLDRQQQAAVQEKKL